MVKAKGHAKARDVRNGAVRPGDKAGNEAADELARFGAALHAVPSQVVTAQAGRRCMARAVHSMMVRVLKARSALERELGLGLDDSDDEDCVEVDLRGACAPQTGSGVLCWPAGVG